MTRNHTTGILVALFLTTCLLGCASVPTRDAARSDQAEIPVSLTACQLMTNPGAYNHKLVQVSGQVSHGFEDFALYADGECPAKNMIWLDLGGSSGSNTIYCCGDHHRNVPLVVEGVGTPLVDDAKTRRFVRIIQSGTPSGGPSTLIGRFFSGEERTLPGGTFWLGYGHMGCCSLLVVQQVLD